MVDWSVGTGALLPSLIPAPLPAPGWTWTRGLVSPSLRFLPCRMETVVTNPTHRKLIGSLALSPAQVRFGLGVVRGSCNSSSGSWGIFSTSVSWPTLAERHLQGTVTHFAGPPWALADWMTQHLSESSQHPDKQLLLVPLRGGNEGSERASVLSEVTQLVGEWHSWAWNHVCLTWGKPPGLRL